jgi:hypothetical protein
MHGLKRRVLGDLPTWKHLFFPRDRVHPLEDDNFSMVGYFLVDFSSLAYYFHHKRCTWSWRGLFGGFDYFIWPIFSKDQSAWLGGEFT